MRRPRRTTRSWPPGMPSPPCRAKGSPPRRSEVRRNLTASQGRESHPDSSPGRPCRARRRAPSSMAEVVARYVSLFGQLEARQKEQAAQAPGKASTPLSEPEWESLRQAIYRPGGPLAVSDDPRSLFLNQTQRNQLAQAQRGHRSAECDRCVGSRRGPWCSTTRPSRSSRTSSSAAIRVGRARRSRGGSSACWPVRSRPRSARGAAGSSWRRPSPTPANPLTARVLVNRVWHWHFGKGLVTTPSDFGLRSDPPSHPELLDHLAAGFLADGWSIKALHRRIMLSSTYQQSSAPRPDAAMRDPENRLVWRFNPQRLDFESMRDSILAVSGALDPTIGGRPVAITEAPFSTAAHGLRLHRPPEPRRPVPHLRLRRPRRDQPATVRDDRPAAGPVPDEQPVPARAGAPAGRLDPARSVSSASDPTDGIRRLYRRVLGRPPEPDELALAADFLRRQAGPSAPGSTAGSSSWRASSAARSPTRRSPRGNSWHRCCC